MRKILEIILKRIYLLNAGEAAVSNYLNGWANSLNNPREYYLQAFRYFTYFINRDIVVHRKYFQSEKRGFGEDAFHSMWELLYNKYNYQNFLEIGVYRGQTISLNSLLANKAGKEMSVYGISPFDHSGDSVSNYISIDFYEDTLGNFKHFGLPIPCLLKAYSTDKGALDLISSRKWDCIYIDGSHDIEVVRKDWAICSEAIKFGGIIVMDDSALYTEYKNPFFSFKGHEGPSIVADEIAKTNKKFKEVLRVGHNRVFERIV